MKSILYTLVALFFLSGCYIQYVQLCETQSDKLKTADNCFVFENDTVRITYSFWANKGVMAFSVYNKLNKPLYIDWKNSSFVYNSNKLDYWLDREQRDIPRDYEKYSYRGNLILAGHPNDGHLQNPLTPATSNERITFIPPKSFSYRSQFYLLPLDSFIQDASHLTQTTVSRTDNPKKQTIIFEEKFDSATSPLHFRNFIGIKFSENSDDLVFYDHEFFLSSVKKMDARHFHGNIKGFDNRQMPVYENPLQSSTSFFLEPEPVLPVNYHGPR